MALTAYDAVLRRWSDSDGTEDPVAPIDAAFAVIAPALDNPEPVRFVIDARAGSSRWGRVCRKGSGIRDAWLTRSLLR